MNETTFPGKNVVTLNTIRQPTLYMLVGIPGSGKSTWINKFVIANGFKQDSYVVLSTDQYIEEAAKQFNSTYNDCFEYHMYDAEKEMHSNLITAITNNKDIIWDQTNTTTKSRKRKLANFHNKSYNKIAVVFTTPYEECLKRNNNRIGKIIPIYVLESMQKSLQMPDLNEGFDHIVYI